eukprot:4323330-Prymnesium_polylepis.1
MCFRGVLRHECLICAQLPRAFSLSCVVIWFARRAVIEETVFLLSHASVLRVCPALWRERARMIAAC